jgi:hypothetical protein
LRVGSATYALESKDCHVIPPLRSLRSGRDDATED